MLLDSDMQLLPAVSWPLLSSLAGDSSPELVPDPEPDKVRCRVPGVAKQLANFGSI